MPTRPRARGDGKLHGMSERISFPRQHARTRGFSLGLPRTFAVAGDGSRVAFLRSKAGDDPVNALRVFDVEERIERLVFDPAGGEGELSEAERAMRERLREKASGVTAYSTDRNATTAAFVLDGRLHAADLVAGGARELPAAAPAFDPRPDPAGGRIAYAWEGALRVIDADGKNDRELASDPDASWGLAEFVAAEEMDRRRGFWWSPDGERIAAARVDEGPVEVWHIADPVEPTNAPRAVRYPRAGTPNAVVTLHVLGLDGSRTDVEWDGDAFPYLARVRWQEGRPLTLLVQSRDQRATLVLAVDEASGATTIVREDRDDRWVELVAGSPRWLADGRLVSTVDADDTRRLAFAGEPVTPPGLQVRRILHVDDDALVAASEDPLEVHVYRVSADGGLRRLTSEPGVHTAVAGDDVLLVTSAPLDRGPVSLVRRGDEVLATLASHAEEPVVEPRPTFFLAGSRELRSALLTPGGAEPTSPLPVLLSPYGGPLHQEVMRTRGGFPEDQWFADQGFGVLVTDGRGSPGRGVAWEKAVHLDLLGPALEDQVDALHAAAERFGFLDLSRVAIRGWSFGGYLAAAAVLRRPEVFHAAIAGAPVVDDRLYDTHYTERYLGRPEEQPEAYRRGSLLADAAKLERPLLLIHGTTDDNVFVANTLQLSRALLEAGRPHSVLPLSSVTHMTPQEEVAENLLLLQLEFLRAALGLGEGQARVT